MSDYYADILKVFETLLELDQSSHCRALSLAIQWIHQEVNP